jgi:hypothetical protein
MAKESKRDRIVRNMLDQVTEHLHELRNLEANPASKESDVERWVQSFLKNCLGYMSSAGYSIRAQETKGKHRPDLVILASEKPIIMVEVKKLGFNLNKSDFRSGKIQLSEYLQAAGNVKWGILTNGMEWKLFDFSNPVNGGIQISSFEIKNEENVIDTGKRSVEELCYDMFDFHEMIYQSGSWADLSKEATVFSPETLAKAILSYDTVKYIAKTIRGEYEYKANFEDLCDRVHSLLELGLNDAHVGWNEAKSIELQKFVKSQKRVGRKSRKAKAHETSPAPEQSATTVDVSAAGTKPNVA